MITLCKAYPSDEGLDMTAESCNPMADMATVRTIRRQCHHDFKI